MARPLTVLRAPGGADGQQFMQKQAPKHYPDWVVTRVRTPKREGGAIDMPAADEPAVLAYLAQQGTLEVHAWLSAARLRWSTSTRPRARPRPLW